MLRSLKDLEHYTVSATDGDVGHVVNFLLDDERWGVRYLVVETGSYFGGRQVLISPVSFRNADWATQRFHVSLTMDKVKRAPSVDLDKPVSRQHEQDYLSYYGYPYYWGYSGLWGVAAVPSGPAVFSGNEAKPVEPNHGDVHLRSAAELRGYHIHGSDKAIGHVADFIVDDATWAVLYMVVDTKNWWFGKKVLIAPHWASRISWDERSVYLNLLQRQIQESPRWDAEAAVNRTYEARLYDYYGRPAYWEDADKSIAATRSHDAGLLP